MMILECLLILPVITAVRSLNRYSYAERRSDGLPELKFDEGWLTLNVSTNYPIQVYTLNDECWICRFGLVTQVTGNQYTTILVNTTYGTSVSLRRRHSNHQPDEEFCRFHRKFTEGGNYWVFVDEESYTTEKCDALLINNPLPAEMPILYVFLGLCALGVVIIAGKIFIGKIRSKRKLMISDPKKTSSNKTDSAGPQKVTVNSTELDIPQNGTVLTTEIKEHSTEPSRTRLKSLDTFRGLSLVIMIFVNFGGGGYWFFDHPPWNGLTVADLVFPWFIFIMGTSMNFSFKGMIRRKKTRLQIFLKVVKRAALLFAFGIILNTNWGPVDLEHLRIPGVLQRFSLTYLVLGLIELVFMNNYNIPKERKLRALGDIISLAPQWLISLGILAVQIIITFKLHVPGCPTGYIGPGGLHDSGLYYNCTAGAASYIDVMVLGKNHIYGNPTPKKIYQTSTPHDPEGILGTLTSIFMCFLGIQAGRVLVCFKSHRSRIIRWVLWGIITGAVGALLCKCSKNDGWIPLNKNLWSPSFVLVTACFAFFLLTAMYICIDIVKIWDGDPFIYPGMNSIVVYCCHDIFYRFFPVNWKVHEDHSSLLLKAVWDTAIFVVLAYVLFRKKIFVAL